MDGSGLGLALGVSLSVLVACGGSEFASNDTTDAGDAGLAGTGGLATDGGSDAANTGGGGGSNDAAPDVPPSSCTSELFGATCTDALLTTGDATCDACGRQHCCDPINACLQNELCAQELRCYLASCLGQSAFNCVPQHCAACLGGTGSFFGVSSCLQNNCTPACPMLIP